MRYRDENSNLRSHITTLRWFAGFCVLAIIGLWVGWQQAKESLRIYIPPDLRSGAVVKAEDVQPAQYLRLRQHRLPAGQPLGQRAGRLRHQDLQGGTVSDPGVSRQPEGGYGLAGQER